MAATTNFPVARIPATLTIESTGAFSRITLGEGELPIHLVHTPTDDPTTATYLVDTADVRAGVVDMLRAAADAIEADGNNPT